MDKTGLKKQLSKLSGFQDPRVELEQYATPPELAADMVHYLKMNGVEQVVDLGTGTGVLAIAAELAGIDATGLEIDGDALKVARENAEELGVNPEFVHSDAAELSREFEACVMNPPFNVQSDEGLAFWRAALEHCELVLGLAGKGFEPRLKRLCDEFNHKVVDREAYRIGLPKSFEFHTEEFRETPVDLYVTRRKE